MLLFVNYAILDFLGNNFIILLVSSVLSFLGSYIYIRERVLKNELKTEHITQYVDGEIKVIETRMRQLQEDITDFKEINKETSRSLVENTAAIRELKLVLEMFREELTKIKDDN